jgi:hypothetical protein
VISFFEGVERDGDAFELKGIALSGGTVHDRCIHANKRPITINTRFFKQGTDSNSKRYSGQK